MPPDGHLLSAALPWKQLPLHFPLGSSVPTCPWRGAPEAPSFGLHPGTRLPSSHTGLLLPWPRSPWSGGSHPALLPMNSSHPWPLRVRPAELSELQVSWKEASAGRTAGSLASGVGLVLGPHPLQTDGRSDSPLAVNGQSSGFLTLPPTFCLQVPGPGPLCVLRANLAEHPVGSQFRRNRGRSQAESGPSHQGHPWACGRPSALAFVSDNRRR